MNARYFVVGVTSIATLSLSLLLWGMPPENVLLFSTPNNNRVYVLNPQSSEKELLYEYTEDCWLHDLKASATGKLIGIIITKRGFTPPGAHDYSILPKNSMVFIDTDGNEITRLDKNVRKFSWSPDGEMIAYIAGTYYEGGVGFTVTSVGIFDLKDKSITRIKKDFPHKSVRGYEGGGIEIKWAQHDNNIYIRDFDYLDGVYRYNTKIGKSENVEYKGIDFSPDGKYYEELEGVHVYLSATNEDITSQLVARFGPDWSRVTMNWVFNEGNCLHFVRKTAVQKGEFKWEYPVVHNVLYDVDKDEVVKEVTMPLSRWTAGPNSLVFEQDGKFVVETFESVHKR